MRPDIPGHGVPKKSEGHIAYEPLKDRNASTAKKSGPAEDFTSRPFNKNPALALDKRRVAERVASNG
jgi:hypothetical protein